MNTDNELFIAWMIIIVTFYTLFKLLSTSISFCGDENKGELRSVAYELEEETADPLKVPES